MVLQYLKETGLRCFVFAGPESTMSSVGSLTSIASEKMLVDNFKGDYKGDASRKHHPPE